VSALAQNVKGQEWAKERFPDDWETHSLSGVMAGRDKRSLLV
jgi:hypothetical protein